jgi:hypothetical protein
MKIVLNRCYGGFGITEEQAKAMGLEWIVFESQYGNKFKGYAKGWNEDKGRLNPILIESVERGDKQHWASDLWVCEIPDDAHYVISNYDGVETLYYSLSEIYEV